MSGSDLRALLHKTAAARRDQQKQADMVKLAPPREKRDSKDEMDKWRKAKARQESLRALAKTAAKRKERSRFDRAKAYAPLGVVGGTIGLGKGFLEETIKEPLERALGLRKKLPAKMRPPKWVLDRMSKKTLIKHWAKEKSPWVKKKLPWAVARGTTGAASTMIIGMTMADMLRDLKKNARD
jgi:hypothetical protein